jgi:FAD synthase
MNNQNLSTTADMLSGVYSGYCKFLSNYSLNKSISLEYVHKCVLSIGWNPFYINNVKTIEVFLIDYEGDNFYGEELEVTLRLFLRTEASFENFGELVTSITYDIILSNRVL